LYDLFIIGGGINGAGIARDASGRNLKVILVDKGNVGSATSSWSTKLIHGGLRYLENYDFKLVRESLKERDIILNIANNIVEPIPFIIPYNSTYRSFWLIKIGLKLYDFLSGKTTIPKSSTINISQKYPNILKSNFYRGFQYFDLQVDDKKLTELNIESAKKNNAIVLEKTNIKNVNRLKNHWKIVLTNNQEFNAKVIINATGPWINEVNNSVLKIKSSKKIRLVKGSHIILDKIYDQKIAFTFQNSDKRIVFAIPFKDKFTLVGTTEIDVEKPDNPKITEHEIDYLLKCINKYFIKNINKEMIISSYSGVRPLIENYKENVSKITRDYIFDIDYSEENACLVNIYGGKLTTYRKLSEKVVNSLKVCFPNLKKQWTKDSILN
tara:strand:+ start:137 stop:1282 length:1146 start_codon:yes stop_codon:yes gene_type:complete